MRSILHTYTLANHFNTTETITFHWKQKKIIRAILFNWKIVKCFDKQFFTWPFFRLVWSVHSIHWYRQWKKPKISVLKSMVIFPLNLQAIQTMRFHINNSTTSHWNLSLMSRASYIIRLVHEEAVSIKYL